MNQFRLFRVAVALASTFSSLAFAQGNGVAQSAPSPLPAGQGQQAAANGRLGAPTPLPEPFIAPFSAQEIRSMRRTEAGRTRAATGPLVIPEVRGKSIDADLSLTAKAPLLRIAPGSGVTLVFVDSTGKSWPIDRVDNFNEDSFEILGLDKEGKAGAGNFSVRAKSQYGIGTFNVILRDVPMPLPYQIETAMDARTISGVREVRVPGRGPNALPEAVYVDRRPDYDPVLAQLLDGLPPQGATQVRVDGGQAVGYRLPGGQLALRTNLEIMSPAPTGKRTDANGTHVFSLPYAPVVLATGGDGRVVTLTVGQ